MHQETRDNLFQDNLGLVRKIVDRMNYGLVEYDDLFQAGCLGLVTALKSYNPKLGKLSTYAVPFIIGEISRETRRGKLVKLPKKILKIINKIDLNKSIKKNAIENPIIDEPNRINMYSFIIFPSK